MVSVTCCLLMVTVILRFLSVHGLYKGEGRSLKFNISKIMILRLIIDANFSSACSASSGGGGRGASQHYTKTVGNR